MTKVGGIRKIMVLWQAVFLAASPLVTAPPSNLTRLYYNGSAAKSHSTTTQYRQLRRLLPSIRAFSAAEKWLFRSTGVGGFIYLKNGNLRRWKLSTVFRRCYILLCQDWLRKDRDKYKVSLMIGSSLILPRIQHKVVLLVLRTVFAVGFWLLSFLQLKLWARIPLQIGDSPSAVVLYLCVNFHKCVSVAF